MDVLNYDSAVSAFNNLEAYQSEKQEQLKDLVQQYRQGAETAILPAIELYQRGKALYNKFTAEKPVVGQGENAVAEGENAVAEGESTLSSAIEGAQGAVRGAASETLGSLSEGAESAISGITSRLGEFSSSIRGIGNQLSERMRTNAFERDPESEIAGGEENMGIFDRAQSLFRGGVSEASQGVESAMSGVRGGISGAISEGSEAVQGAVSEAATTAAETVGTAVGEGIGEFIGSAIPIVGELGMLGLGVYDFVKSFTEKPATVQAFATPIFEKGV
jgi:hypothetical protein